MGLLRHDLVLIVGSCQDPVLNVGWCQDLVLIVGSCQDPVLNAGWCQDLVLNAGWCQDLVLIASRREYTRRLGIFIRWNYVSSSRVGTHSKRSTDTDTGIDTGTGTGRKCDTIFRRSFLWGSTGCCPFFFTGNFQRVFPKNNFHRG